MAIFEQLPTIAFYDSKSGALHQPCELSINIATQNPVSYRTYNRTCQVYTIRQGEPLLLFAPYNNYRLYGTAADDTICQWYFWPLIPMLKDIIPKNAVKWKNSTVYAPVIHQKHLMDENGINYEAIATASNKLNKDGIPIVPIADGLDQTLRPWTNQTIG